ncbi:hypothetical protein AV530_001583 [Patagioenas fasciata monilis]|uniref:Uncharacterized protein n=1 Tax=Patagioenas fasciata monilis TaxID=372326 RepID=A0A1V4K6W9_PATFA|nr:hypothetical protein AV530_001583 [Patagioenas fasciata monilis]
MGGGAGGRARKRAQLPQRGEEKGGTVSVGWSGNPVIKRGARGKSRELILSPHHRICKFTRSPRAHGRRLEPLGAELSGVERRGAAAFTCRRPGRAQHSARRRTRLPSKDSWSLCM